MAENSKIEGSKFWTTLGDGCFGSLEDAWAFEDKVGSPVNIEGPWFQTSDGEVHDDQEAMDRHIKQANQAPFDYEAYNIAGMEQRLPGQEFTDADGIAKFEGYIYEIKQKPF